LLNITIKADFYKKPSSDKYSGQSETENTVTATFSDLEAYGGA
jgi:hypothetical protein